MVLFTPKSASILPSITKYSLTLAKERLGMTALEGDVYIDRLADFSEAGACGTAAIISLLVGFKTAQISMYFIVKRKLDQ